jgi:hypothetical protein
MKTKRFIGIITLLLISLHSMGMGFPHSVVVAKKASALKAKSLLRMPLAKTDESKTTSIISGLATKGAKVIYNRITN